MNHSTNTKKKETYTNDRNYNNSQVVNYGGKQEERNHQSVYNPSNTLDVMEWHKRKEDCHIPKKDNGKNRNILKKPCCIT